MGARSGGCDRQGRGTQADMIFMLGFQSGAEPEARTVGASGGGRQWEGGRQKPDEGQLWPLPGEDLLGDTYLLHGTLRPRVGTEQAILVQSSKKGTSCAPAPSFLPVALQEQLRSLSISRARRQGLGWQEQRAPSQQSIPDAGPSRLLSSLAETFPGRAVRVCNPADLTGPGRSSPSGPLGSSRAESPRGQDGHEGHPSPAPTLGLTPAKDTQGLGLGRRGVRGLGWVGGANCLILGSALCPCPSQEPGPADIASG